MDIVSLKQAKQQGLGRYFTGKPCKHGHVCERYVSRRGCVQCTTECNRAFQCDHSSYNKTYKQTNKGRARNMLGTARGRALQKNRPYDLTTGWLEPKLETGKCELSGLDFDLGGPAAGMSRNPYAPSIDRIDSGKGYTKDNCRVVLLAVNMGLNQWGYGVYARIAAACLNRN